MLEASNMFINTEGKRLNRLSTVYARIAAGQQKIIVPCESDETVLYEWLP